MLLSACGNSVSEPEKPLKRLEPLSVSAWPLDRPCAVTIHYDDTRLSSITTAAPNLEEFGFRGSFALNAYYVGEATGTWDQWRDLASRGHEIMNHGYSHRLLGEITLEEIEEEISLGRQMLEDSIGVSVNHFVYPGCSISDEAVEIATRYHKTARCGSGRNDPRNYDRGLVKGYGWGTNSKYKNGPEYLEELYADVDKAIAEGSWLIIYFHGLGTHESEVDEYIHKSFLAYLKAKNVWVATHDEVYQYITPPVIGIPREGPEQDLEDK